MAKQRGQKMAIGNFTPTETRILNILKDGKRHKKQEFYICFSDGFGSRQNIWPHMTAIRKKLRHLGETIVCEWYQGGFYYRHVRLLEDDS